jgi:hypothetical protein
VSEELLHRAIRSNVELAEALTDIVREMNQGLGIILSQAEALQSQREEGKRAVALALIEQEGARLRLILAQLGQAAAKPGAAPRPPAPATAAPPPLATAPSPRPAPASPAAPAPSALPPVPVLGTPAPVASGGLDGVLAEAVESALAARAVSIQSKLVPGTSPPRCPAPSLRRALTALLHGLAMSLPPRSVVAIRAERKPVLLRGRDGEVKRDFLMLALSHGASLSAEEQQRMLQGNDPGPLGEAYRLVREMGGFLRFAPLPGGALETRVFLPAV